MNIPNDLKYTREHEWVKIDGNILPLMQNLQFFKDLIASNREKKG